MTHPNPADLPDSSTVCPVWCNGEHESTEGAPFAHRSDGIVVAGVERVIRDRQSTHMAAVVEITVGLEQVHDEAWVWLGTDRPGYRPTILSIESAKRLLRQVSRLIEPTG